MDKKLFITKVLSYSLMFYSFFSMLLGVMNEEPINYIDVIIMMAGFMLMSIINYVQHRK